MQVLRCSESWALSLIGAWVLLFYSNFRVSPLFHWDFKNPLACSPGKANICFKIADLEFSGVHPSLSMDPCLQLLLAIVP